MSNILDVHQGLWGRVIWIHLLCPDVSARGVSDLLHGPGFARHTWRACFNSPHSGLMLIVTAGSPQD